MKGKHREGRGAVRAHTAVLLGLSPGVGVHLGTRTLVAFLAERLKVGGRLQGPRLTVVSTRRACGGVHPGKPRGNHVSSQRPSEGEGRPPFVPNGG